MDTLILFSKTFGSIDSYNSFNSVSHSVILDFVSRARNYNASLELSIDFSECEK